MRGSDQHAQEQPCDGCVCVCAGMEQIMDAWRNECMEGGMHHMCVYRIGPPNGRASLHSRDHIHTAAHISSASAASASHPIPSHRITSHRITSHHTSMDQRWARDEDVGVTTGGGFGLELQSSRMHVHQSDDSDVSETTQQQHAHYMYDASRWMQSCHMGCTC